MLNSRHLDTLPSDIKRNPREHVQVVTLRSGKEFNAPKTQKKKNDEEKKVAEEE